MPDLSACQNLTTVNFSGVPLPRLPQNIFEFSAGCIIYSNPTNFSEAHREWIHANVNAPDYTGPILSGMGIAPRPEGVRPLEVEVAALMRQRNGIWGNENTLVWRTFSTETNANNFAQFLFKLRQTSEYRNENLRADFLNRGKNIIHQIQEDSQLRGSCFNLAGDAIDSCGDRVAMRFMDMEALCLDVKMIAQLENGIFDENPQAIVAFCKSQYRHQILTDAAKAKIRTLNGGDEIEVILGFLVRGAKEFTLPVKMNTMLYSRLSFITEEDMIAVRKKLTNRGLSPEDQSENNDAFFRFLTNSPLMNAILNRSDDTKKVSTINNKINEEVANAKNRLHEEHSNLDINSKDYAEASVKFQVEFNNLDINVRQRFLPEIINDYVRKHRLDINL